MKKFILSMLCVGFAFTAMAQQPQMPAGGFGGFQFPTPEVNFSEKFADINYAADGEAYHTLDIYLPKVKKESYPVVIHIYGSAWFSNNSKGMADLGTICNALLDAGYAVVTPNHRSSSDAKFPAQVNDIKAVVRFVRAEAEKYNFDTSFIATSGFSSGGHLASLTAVTNGETTTNVGSAIVDIEGNVGPYTSQSSYVNAACDWSGPIDLLNMDCAGVRGAGANAPEVALVGCEIEGNEDKFKAISPISYLDENDVPVIVFHGTDDNVVPCCQGANFYDALVKAGIKTEFTAQEGGGHGFNMYTEENLAKMVNFFNSVRYDNLMATIDMENVVTPVTNINQNGFPKILPDNSVVFMANAPAAQDLKIDIGGKRYSMIKNAQGRWLVKTAPQAPGYHYYSLVVDGVSVVDPASEAYYGMSRMASAIDIPEEGADDFEVQDVPHGQVRELRYFSKMSNSWRPVFVYTPASYEKGKKKYPVVYIHHGGGEDHRGWIEQGRTANIMDNLIAKGEAEEMIVVSVNTNLPAQPGVRRGGYNWEGMQPYRSELIDNIIPFIESNFRVKADRKYRAMCGLSMGGGQSFYIGLRSPEVFANVASFSSGIFGGIAGSNKMDFEKEIPGILTATDKFNEDFDVFLLTCGTEDPRITHTKDAYERLKEAGVDVKYADFPGDHEWQPWRKSFSHFAKMLFK